MTPEERAKDVLDGKWAYGGAVRRQLAPPYVEDLEQAIASAVREALAAEREACARLCETLRGDGPVPSAGALDCARAIRARGKP